MLQGRGSRWFERKEARRGTVKPICIARRAYTHSPRSQIFASRRSNLSLARCNIAGPQDFGANLLKRALTHKTMFWLSRRGRLKAELHQCEIDGIGCVVKEFHVQASRLKKSEAKLLGRASVLAVWPLSHQL